jgi:hypothetical protein
VSCSYTAAARGKFRCLGSFGGWKGSVSGSVATVPASGSVFEEVVLTASVMRRVLAMSIRDRTQEKVFNMRNLFGLFFLSMERHIYLHA